MNELDRALDAMRDAIASHRDAPERLIEPLDRFHDSGYLQRRIARMLDRGVDSTRESVRDIGENNIRLDSRPEYSLHLEIWRAPKPLLHSTAVDSVLRVISPTPVLQRVYRIDGPFDPEVFIADVPLRLESERRIDGIAHAQRKGEGRVYDYVSESPFLTLELSLRPADPYLWFFDRERLRSTYASFSGAQLSGYTLSAKALAAVGEARALPLLMRMTEHPSHAVRWAAIQALGRIDGDAAFERLERAEHDPHPHIRNAAARTLARLRTETEDAHD